MAVTVGANAQLLLDAYSMTEYFRSMEISMSKDILDATVFGLGSRQKAVGLKHGRITGEAFYDDTATIGSYDALKNKFPSGTAGTLTLANAGFGFGNRVFQIYSESVKFEIQTVIDDLIKIMTEAEARERGVDIGISLHALSAETTFPFSGTSVDNGAATANGGVGTVSVTAIAGASPNAVYKIQHSTNDSTWVDLITFGGIGSAPVFSRSELANGQTVNRYVRTTITDSGTTSSVTGAVVFSRR